RDIVVRVGQRDMQKPAVLFVELVGIDHDHLDLGSFGQRGGLIHTQSTVCHSRFHPEKISGVVRFGKRVLIELVVLHPRAGPPRASAPAPYLLLCPPLQQGRTAPAPCHHFSPDPKRTRNAGKRRSENHGRTGSSGGNCPASPARQGRRDIERRPAGRRGRSGL